MKITATVVKIDAEKWEAQGRAYSPEKLWVAYWSTPSVRLIGAGTGKVFSPFPSVTIIGHAGRDKADALINLRVEVLRYLESQSWEAIDEVEVDL